MRIRQLTEEDIPRIKELHSKLGFKYPFPNYEEFFPIPVVVDENDVVVMSVWSLPSVELYFFCDSEWETPGMRMEAFKLIHEFVRIDLFSRGIVEANAFLPQYMVKSFGRRLLKTFKWIKNKRWAHFSRRTDYG